MRWSEDTKDFAASQKLMAGKRLPEHLRENIGGPSKTTILNHLKDVRREIQPGSPGVAHNMQSIGTIWEPLIVTRREKKSDEGEVIMVEMSEDETGIVGRIEYWRARDSIYGSCGWKSPTHKCNDHFHPVIGSSWDRLVDIMRKAVVSSYLRVIMVNPLCDWLPAMPFHINATCNQFDHHPQVTNQWNNTLKCFDRTLKPLGCNLTGRSSDGDGRRFKLQYELHMIALEKLSTLRRCATCIQRRWRRQNSFPWVISQIVRRLRNVRRNRVTLTAKLTFTVPITLEGADGFTFVAMATFDARTGKMLAITDLSVQDPKHKGKRLDMPLQSSAKTMLIGRYCASAIDLFLD